MTHSVSTRARRRRTSAELVAAGFVVWVFVWDNARQGFGDVTNPLFILPLPRAMKFVEVLVLLVLLVYVVVAHRNRGLARISGIALLLVAIGVTMCSSVIGIIAGYTTAAAALNASYAYLSPVILATVVAALSNEWDDPTWLFGVFEKLVVLNAAAAWYQLAIQHAWGDAVHGFMHDAHMYANTAWLAVLLILIRLYSTGRGWWRASVMLLLFAPTAWAAQHEMAQLVFAVVLLAGLFLMLWRWGLVSRMLTIGLYGAAVVLFVTALQTESPVLGGLGRLELVASNIQGLGIVEGYEQVPSAMTTVPYSFLIGTGPGSYGSAAALEPSLNGGTAGPLVARYTGESYELNEATRGLLGSFIQKSTDLTALLVEFGPFVILLLAAALWLLVGRPAVRAVRSSAASTRTAGLWVLGSLVFIIALSAGTAFYGWSAAHTSVFAIVAAGALLQRPLSPGPMRPSAPASLGL